MFSGTVQMCVCEQFNQHIHTLHVKGVEVSGFGSGVVVIARGALIHLLGETKTKLDVTKGEDLQQDSRVKMVERQGK